MRGGGSLEFDSAASGRWLESAPHDSSSLSVDRLLAHPEWRPLIPMIERLGRDPSRDLPLLARYVQLLIAWNRSVSNLISRNDESRIVSRHIGESIEPAAMLAETGVADWIDFGSGAGLPALPLVIVGIGRKWNLVESRRPKALFMRRVIQELGLDGIRVTHARLEEVIGEMAVAPMTPPTDAARDRADEGAVPGPVAPSRADSSARAGASERDRPGADESNDLVAGAASQQTGGYGGFTSRATLRLAPTLALAARVVRVGGYAFLWKGSRREQELAEQGPWRERWDLVGEFSLASGSVAVCKFSLRG